MKELLKCPVYVDQCTLHMQKNVSDCLDKANWNSWPYTDVPNIRRWRGVVNGRRVGANRTWIPGFHDSCCSDFVCVCDQAFVTHERVVEMPCLCRSMHPARATRCALWRNTEKHWPHYFQGMSLYQGLLYLYVLIVARQMCIIISTHFMWEKMLSRCDHSAKRAILCTWTLSRTHIMKWWKIWRKT